MMPTTRMILISLAVLVVYALMVITDKRSAYSVPPQYRSGYWLVLYRESNLEFLYFGIPGDPFGSVLMKTFPVKTGVPRRKPTPLPQIMGRRFWLITDKEETGGNPETAPYFLHLDVPGGLSPPYGPVPYAECRGQCNWEVPGPFGLHGVNGDVRRLSPSDPGSSGCVRHHDGDITYLYSILDLPRQPVRYYIYDR